MEPVLLWLFISLALADDAQDYEAFIQDYVHGELAAAERRARDLLVSRTQAFGPEHVKVAEITGDLGAVRRARGALREGIQLTSRALDLYEQAVGLDHPDALSARNNLALMHQEQGHTALAMANLREVVRLRREQQAPDDLLALSLNNLAGLHLKSGDEEGAEALYLEALSLDISERSRADMLINLAQVYTAPGHEAQYDAILEEAVPLVLENLREHFDTAIALAINDSIRRISRGEPAEIRRAQALLERLAGEMSHDSDRTRRLHIQSLLGRIHLSFGEWESALTLLAPALSELEQSQGADSHFARGAREWLAQAYILSGQQDLARQLTAELLDERLRDGQRMMGQLSDRARLEWVEFDQRWLNLWMATDPMDEEVAWNTALAWKGLATTASVQQRQAAERLTEPSLVAKREALDELRAQLAQTSWTSGSHEASAALAQRVDSLESDLAQAVHTKGLLQPTSVRVAELCAALGPDEALVDWLYLNRSVPGATDRYRAWAVRGDQCDTVLQVDVDAAALEQAVVAWRKTLASILPERQQSRGEAVYQALWEPLLPVVEDAGTIWLVPDQEVARVGLAALPDPRGGYLLDHHHIRLLDHPADLLTEPSPPPRGKALIVADVDYGPASARQRTSDCAGGPLGDLPGTATEARAVRRGLRKTGLRATVLSGQDATETAVEQTLPAHSWLHVATHGFFGDVSCLAGGGEDRREGWQDPLLRAGLVFAPDGSREGVWTGQEVAAQRLDGLSGVVLSACDTGLGTLRTGEGVQGLRRGFKLAGARRLVMSLWSVPDQDTARLMGLFYSHFDPQDPARSLLEAQRALLAEQRAMGFTDPRGWGAFVFVGR